MSRQVLRVATRKSPLAVWQANYVKQALQSLHPQLNIEFVKLSTKGDEILDKPLAKIGGKGLFVKELERALLAGDADLAVHSMKDMPTEQPPGLDIAVLCQREQPWDAFVSNNYEHFADLPKGARVGTSSLRRQAQLKVLRPDLETINVRGNVNTRLEKLDNENYDAIILAAAGLMRLEKPQRIQHLFEAQQLLPAAGQGAVGVQCRNDDVALLELLQPLHHQETAICVSAERALTHCLGGNCQTPIAAYAEIQANMLTLCARVLSPDGKQFIAVNGTGAPADALTIGRSLAAELIAKGAQELLEQS